MLPSNQLVNRLVFEKLIGNSFSKNRLDADELNRNWLKSGCYLLATRSEYTFIMVPMQFLIFQCRKMHVKIENISLNSVMEARVLGLIFDEKIDFRKHTEIFSKSYAMLGFMVKVCSDFGNLFVLQILYFEHVRSLLEFWFCAVVFELCINRVIWKLKRQNYVRLSNLKSLYCRRRNDTVRLM